MSFGAAHEKRSNVWSPSCEEAGKRALADRLFGLPGPGAAVALGVLTEGTGWCEAPSLAQRNIAGANLVFQFSRNSTGKFGLRSLKGWWGCRVGKDLTPKNGWQELDLQVWRINQSRTVCAMTHEEDVGELSSHNVSSGQGRELQNQWFEQC